MANDGIADAISESMISRARSRVALIWTAITAAPARVGRVSEVVFTSAVSQTVDARSSVDTSVLSRVPTSVHRASDRARTGARY